MLVDRIVSPQELNLTAAMDRDWEAAVEVLVCDPLCVMSRYREIRSLSADDAKG